MTKPSIALFVNPKSPETQELVSTVEQEGGSPLVLDLRLGGASQPRATMACSELAWSGISFKEIRSVFIRSLNYNTPPSLPAVLNESTFAELKADFWREQAYQASAYSFLESFARQGGLLINPPTSAYMDHESKSQFYEKLRGQGFNVPRSLTTNDAEKALAFIKGCQDVVVKPACGVGSTRRVTATDIDSLGSLSLCPTLFQEYIAGDCFRVNIVGGTVVLALKIVSINGGTVDSRSGKKETVAVSLPADEIEKIVAANRLLGLHYAAWDVIATPQGEIFYLDCNPGPYLGWLEEHYRHVIFRQLAIYMVTFSLTGCLSTATSRVTAYSGI